MVMVKFIETMEKTAEFMVYRNLSKPNFKQNVEFYLLSLIIRFTSI